MAKYKHLKTGGIYELICNGARLEKEGFTGFGMVVYKSCETGQVWIRPSKEFFDGRFEFISSDEGDKQ